MPLVIGLIKASLPSYFPQRHGVFDAALAALEEIAGACGARIVEAEGVPYRALLGLADLQLG